MRIRSSIPGLVVTVSVAFLSCTSALIEPPSEVGCATPVIAAVRIDQPKSMRSTSTATPTIEEFDPLIDKLVECGGELEVAFIRDRPETGAPRVRFPEPPPMPEKPVKGAEEEEYEFGDRMADYARRFLARRDDMAGARTKLQPEIQAFRGALRERLLRPLADHTDFNSALNDAELFLESAAGAGWRNPPEQYLIINSDALDEGRKPRLNIKSGATVFWINTSTDDKALAGFQFTRVSDFTTAVRRITDK